ncbi:MAG: DUF1573 domain-containing protein [Bacteroides sp.]|nr:DUF1573 domain-containing protein [Bacteroides sp.]
MNKNELLLLLLITISVVSCVKSTGKDFLINEWDNVEIEFPVNSIFKLRGTIVNKDSQNIDYKIIIYMRMADCKDTLWLSDWYSFMEEVELMAGEKVVPFFIFHPQCADSPEFHRQIESFIYPICFDIDDEFYNKNILIKQYNYQTFLLNENNSVLAVGNPIYNRKVRNLYKRIISSKSLFNNNTTVYVNKHNLLLNDLEYNKMNICRFEIRNIGDKPLYISDIETTCDCTKAVCIPETIPPNENGIIEVKMHLDTWGYISQTLFVYCNIEKKIIELTIDGIVKK